MSTPAQREAWAIRWGVGLLVVLTACLSGLVLYSTVQTAAVRQAAAERAVETLDRLERVAAELDVHGAELARLAEAIEGQAADVASLVARLEAAAEAGERSRAQFQQAVREILTALGSDVDVFTSTSQPEPEGECTPPQSRRCRDG